MADEIHHGDGQIEHPSIRYERTDASFRGVVFVTLAVAVFGAVALAALLVFFRSYREYQANVKKSPFPLAPAPSTALPPRPRLEQLDRLGGVESANVYEREAAKLDVLNSYGSTTEDGFIHIPIDRAMEMLADKLPHREEPTNDQQKRSAGLIDAGASNSGQMLRGKPR
jgi:hypothetical protein